MVFFLLVWPAAVAPGATDDARTDRRFAAVAEAIRRFIDDVSLPGALHLVLVRSTHARARIGEVDAKAAQACPGVAVFVADDLPQVVYAVALAAVRASG